MLAFVATQLNGGVPTWIRDDVQGSRSALWSRFARVPDAVVAFGYRCRRNQGMNQSRTSGKNARLCKQQLRPSALFMHGNHVAESYPMMPICDTKKGYPAIGF